MNRTETHNERERIPHRAQTLLALLIAAAPTVTEAQQIPTFVTDPKPLLSMGSENGSPALLFSGISDAMRLTDGRIVVASCGSNEVRFFDAKGAHVSSTGQKGNGPGDFQYIRRLFAGGGDSIGVYDGVPNFRVTLLTATGRVGRVFAVPGRIDVMGRVLDGSFIGRLAGAPPPEPGQHRRPVTLYRLDAEAKLVDSLRKNMGSEVVVPATRAPTQVLRLSRNAVIAVFPDRVIVGAQDDDSFTEFAPNLQIMRRVPTLTRGEPVTADVRRAWDAGADVSIADGGVSAVYSPDYAAAMPAYRDIETGTDGRVWLQDPFRPVVYPLTWTAYKDGKAVARAELPTRFAPTQFGTDWVLGVAFDSDGIERVQVLALKPGPPSARKLSPKVAQPPDIVRCGPWVSR
jgi:hypothetical protein